jgi:hypothetical protein
VDGRIRSMEKSSGLIGNRTHDLSACSIVPQPNTLPCAPNSSEERGLSEREMLYFFFYTIRKLATGE